MDAEQLYGKVDERNEFLCGLSDDLFDHPELSGEEYYAADRLAEAFSCEGFHVTRGVGGLETAFRAVYQNGEGGPNLGLLCEYDALPGVGHACGHHSQGPAILGAAAALKETAGKEPFTLTVYGTPEEEAGAGKAVMQKAGCFSELDAALMYHAGQATTADVKSMALSTYRVTFHGRNSHAALAPEEGRSALDAMLLMFHGIEFLREHVKEDTRMHYTVTESGGPENLVPALARGAVALRSYSRGYLDGVIARFHDIVKGAALMTGTTCEIELESACDSKVPVIGLNRLMMTKARELDAPGIRPPREKTGSTDFGNVMYQIPGSCIRVAAVPEDVLSHSQEFAAAGKSGQMHRALILGAKILAGTCRELIQSPELLAEIKLEFRKNKAEF